MDHLGIVMVALVVVMFTKTWQLFKVVVWRPYSVTKMFENQGVRGPPWKLFYGSTPEMKKLNQDAHQLVLDIKSNDIIQKAQPFYYKWSSQYGQTMLYWIGTEPRLIISDAELAKQILSNKFGFFVKPKMSHLLIRVLGNGLVFIDGEDWARHRRILNPAFSIDKLKVMIKKMAECTVEMLDEWKNRAIVAEGPRFKINIDEDFRKLTADIISRTAFGSSYVQGTEAFRAQEELQKYFAASLADADIFIPGSQYLPTPSNIQMWKLERKLKTILEQIVSSKLKSHDGDDLLGIMLEALRSSDSKDSPKLNMKEIMEECRTFFFAGQETSASLLTWTMFLLCKHQEWQDRMREEVMKECGEAIPNADMLTKLKLVNMFVLESLRLYGPASEIIRQASRDLKLGNLTIPKDNLVVINVFAIHRNKTHWGEDAEDFNPLRFKNGVSNAAKHPNALVGFSSGPRVCIGQNFAMIEVKTVVALLLQRFRFELSPDYKHAPVITVTLQPQFGLPVLVTPLSA
ncbi:hypothetical protein K2173_008075 [Erythroxylum novogranatense]|uniref:Cytochrome P450 n=1 Tax=Erythroxylum novogranatense TaxID=1862640 RepID=A0AAV8S8Z8_9ROSI|nr:hypothetical protein K2173_008075 [Erythroxylum novogranatense]